MRIKNNGSIFTQPQNPHKLPSLSLLYPASMQEAIELFIKYTRVSEPTLEGRIARLEQLLRDIATGSWVFPSDFNAWRIAQD